MGTHADTIAQLVAGLSMDRFKKHVELLSEHIGPRPAGSTAERNGAVYVFNELESYGLKPEFVEFLAYVDRPVTCRLEVVRPQRRHLVAESLAWAANTGPSAVTADVIDGGSGSEVDLNSLGDAVRGKIVLARAGEVWRGAALRHAQDRGASGVIWSSRYPEAPISNLGTTGVHIGNPLPGTEFPKLPDVGVCYEDGELLAGWLRSGTLTVRVEVLRDRAWMPTQNVVGTLVGSRYPDQIVSLGAHIDQWSAGAYDSGSQLAGMLEIARTLAESRDRPERSIQFIGWGAHEHGIIGSLYHAFESHADEVRDHVVGHVNCCPFIGGRGQSRAALRTMTSPEILHLTDELVDRYGWREGWTDISPYWDSADHIPFVMHGVPSAQPRGWYLGSANPWYHSVAGDTYRNVHFDEENIRDAFRMQSGLALFLANGPLVPLRYGPVARDFRAEVERLQRRAGEDLDFAPLAAAFTAMEGAAEEISALLDPLLEPLRSPDTLSAQERSALERLAESYGQHGKRLATAIYDLDRVRLGEQILERPEHDIGLLPAFLGVIELADLTPHSREHQRLTGAMATAIGHLVPVVDRIALALRDEAAVLRSQLKQDQP